MQTKIESTLSPEETRMVYDAIGLQVSALQRMADADISEAARFVRDDRIRALTEFRNILAAPGTVELVVTVRR